MWELDAGVGILCVLYFCKSTGVCADRFVMVRVFHMLPLGDNSKPVGFIGA